MEPLKYFNTDDYVSLDAHQRERVDAWLRDNDAMEKISLVQEFDDGNGIGLVLSGPEVDEKGLSSEGELVVHKVLDENTFPWEVLKEIST